MTSELTMVNQFMDTLNEDLEVLWGLYTDDTIGKQVKVAIVATGFDAPDDIIPPLQDKQEEHRAHIEALRHYYYGTDQAQPTNNSKDPGSDPTGADPADPSDPAGEPEPAADPADPAADPADPAGEPEPPAAKKSWLQKMMDFANKIIEE